MFRQRQQGIALITALLIVALATIIASGMLATQNVGIHRSGNLFQGTQAWWYAIGGENWAAQVLKRDREDNDVDHYGEDWAQAMDYLPIEGGFLSGQITDQQGRFNLNNLGGRQPDKTAEQFKRLLRKIEGLDPYLVEIIVAASRDWIDTDIQPHYPEGAEDNYYLSQEPAYRSANRLFTSASEMLLIREVTRDAYQLIQPFIAALPANTPINVNTAPPEVLASLHPEITAEDVAALVSRREQEPFESTQAFLTQEVLAGREIDDESISVNSQHFLLQAQATVGTSRVTLYSLLFRDDQGRSRTLLRSKDSF